MGYEDGAVSRALLQAAPLIPRNYVVMEVRANLIEAERGQFLKRFKLGDFKKTARVVVGEPSAEFREAQVARLLKERQDKEDTIFRARQSKRVVQKQRKEQRKVAAEEAKKRAQLVEEAKTRASEAAKKAVRRRIRRRKTRRRTQRRRRTLQKRRRKKQLA